MAFVEISYIGGSTQQTTTADNQVVFPVDLIIHELDNIPNQAVKISPEEFKNNYMLIAQEIRSQQLNLNVNLALNSLTDKLFPLVRDSISDTYTPSDLLSISKSDLTDVILSSYTKLSVASSSLPTPINGFVNLTLENSPVLNGNSKLRVDLLNSPADKEHSLIREIYYDGIKINPQDFGSYLEANSFKLTTGQHSWVVKTYAVDKKQWNNVDSSIKSWQQNILKLQAQLDEEPDPDKRVEIQADITKFTKYIFAAKNELEDLKIDLNSPAAVSFEVL